MPVGDTRKIPRGTSYRFNFEIEIDGAPADITGATIRFTVKAARYDSDWDDSSALLQADVTSHDDDALGLSHLTLLPDDTAQLPPGDCFYDFKIQLSGGEIYLLEEGQLLLTGSPTNRVDA